MQSAYRRFHSTETAVTKVFNDLLLAADVGQMSALCLLDLTAAFNTVDHELLLSRLERQFGLRGIVLEWFRSYLSGRTFRVIFSGSTSSIIYIVCSVPQGSVLGPLLFIVYTADLADTAEKHGVSLHAFADNTQEYLHCRHTDTTSAAAQLERCIAGVDHWMSAWLHVSMQKTSQFKTQCKGDISHAFETAKITVFYPTVCQTPDAPLQNELLCWTFVHLSLLLTFILWQIFIPLCVTHNCGLHYSRPNYVSITFEVGQGEWLVISGERWHMSNCELVFPSSIWLLLLVSIILCKLLCHSVWLLIAH